MFPDVGAFRLKSASGTAELLALLQQWETGNPRRYSWGPDDQFRGQAHIRRSDYDDLVATGRDLGVSMPVMESYAADIKRFATTASKKE